MRAQVNFSVEMPFKAKKEQLLAYYANKQNFIIMLEHERKGNSSESSKMRRWHADCSDSSIFCYQTCHDCHRGIKNIDLLEPQRCCSFILTPTHFPLSSGQKEGTCHEFGTYDGFRVAYNYDMYYACVYIAVGP